MKTVKAKNALRAVLTAWALFMDLNLRSGNNYVNLGESLTGTSGAAKLSFVDETFDGAVSNFVFHEVRSQPDKLALFQEMLRVLKPGAAFVIQDTYFDKRVYGDINAFVEQLRPRVKEIHFEDTRKPDYAPRFLNTPLVLGQMGVIWGRK